MTPLAVRTVRLRQLGTVRFRKLLERLADIDEWGVKCVYDYDAWKIYRAGYRAGKRERGRK